MSARSSTPGSPGPVAVGGIGGSGTRLVARMLLELGLDLGPDRNDAEDNLWFTLLLRSIPIRARARAARVSASLDVFARAMTGRPLAGSRQRALLLGAVMGAARPSSEIGPLWALERARRIRAASARPLPPRPWGWKEPNTHVFLPELCEQMPDLRYIHVIRDGREVATGRNRAQLYRWGAAFGIDVHRAPDITQAAFRYWLRANVRALTIGRRRLASRFLLVDHGALCARPESVVDRIIAFTGATVDPRLRDRLIAMPDASVARRSSAELEGHLDREERAGLAFLGYG